MSRGTLAILTVLIVMLTTISVIPSALALSQSSFSENVLVTVEDPTHLDQMNPAIAADPQGNISVVWEEYDDYGFSSIFFAHSDDGGESFSNRTVVSESDSEQAEPKVAVNETGWIFVVWSEESPEGSDTMIAHSNDSGATFSPAMEVSPSQNSQVHPDIAVSGSMVFITWAEEKGVDLNITMARSIDGGHTFLPPQRVDDQSIIALQNFPTIAAQGEKVFIAWHDGRFDPFLDIYGSWSNDSGENFSPDIKVSDGILGDRQSRPDVAFLPSGNVTVVWQDDREGNLDIRASRSMGVNFLPSVGIEPGITGDQEFPSVAVDSSGNISVVYRDGRTGNPHISLAISIDGGESFSSGIRVDDVEADSMIQGAPDVSIGSNNTPMVVFEDRRTGDWSIYFSKMLNFPPVCQITSPADGEVVSEWVTIRGNASDVDDNDSLLRVEVRISGIDGDFESDWMEVVGGMNWSVEFNTSTVLNGAYRVEARAHDGRSYSNVDSITIFIANEVQLFPDLAFNGEIVFSPSQLQKMQQVLVMVEVTNLGNVTAHGVEVAFLRGDAQIGEIETIPHIGPGDVKTAFTSWLALEGVHTIKVQLDPEDKIEEVDEDNNYMEEQVQVMPAGYYRPDFNLTQDNITIVPPQLKNKDIAEITVEVRNDGRVNATAVMVSILVDGEEIANGTIDLLPFNTSAQISFNWAAETGEHLIEVIIDPHDATSELDELNNHASVTVDVEFVEAFPGWYLWVAVIAVVLIALALVVFFRWRKV
jgi:hypothetical protein